MSEHHAILLSAAELKIVMAFCDLRQAVFFCSNKDVGRSEQIQAVHRLLKDGLIVDKAHEMRVSEQLLPYLKVFHASQGTTVVRPARSTSPPLCLYYDQQDNRFAAISPSASNPDFYRIFTVDDIELVDELEQLEILPILDDEYDLPDLFCQHSPQMSNAAHLLSKFEYWPNSVGTPVSSLSVFREAASWFILQQEFEKSAIWNYSAPCIASWLKGERI